MDTESIFVQISAYQDSEIVNTINNLINTSSGFYSINFGVHNCFYKKNLFIENKILFKKHCKVSSIISEFPENIGVGKGRYLANSLYDGETYYLQIDSHMRMQENWDIEYISQYKKLYNEYGIDKPLISSYPSNYYYEDMIDLYLKSIENNTEDDYKVIKERLNNIKSYCDNKNGIYSEKLYRKGRCVLEEGSEIESFLNKELNLNIDIRKIKKVFTRLHVSGALVFTGGDFHLIKPNKQIIHKYEEMLIGFRAHTHGYDIYPSELNWAYHLPRLDVSGRLELSSTINKRRSVNVDIHQNNINISEYKDVEEIKDIIINNRIDDQAFGSERNFNDIMNLL